MKRMPAACKNLLRKNKVLSVKTAFDRFWIVMSVLAVLKSFKPCMVEAFVARQIKFSFGSTHTKCFYVSENQLQPMSFTGAVSTLRPNVFSSNRITRRSLHFMMTSDDDDSTDETALRKSIDSEWNMGGLKKEVARLIFRCHKKIGKASTRLKNAKATVEDLLQDDNASMEDLENCPNVDVLEFELTELQSRLGKLNELEEKIKSIKKKHAVLPEDVATLALELEVNDEPPVRKPQQKKKRKGPKVEPKRLPYRRYYTLDKTEIRVGKQAADNDMLSTSPEHRNGSDWWMHASGCPGSHVVIRCDDENLDSEVVQDAASLAARQSKCQGNNIKVSLTRCRQVTKPPGAKPGLVQLNGRIRTITVNMHEAEARLKRLDETVQIN